MVNHEAESPAIVTALLDCLAPAALEQIPSHSYPKAHFEAYSAAPVEFSFDSRTIDSVSAIVTRPIGHELDQVAIGLESICDESGVAISRLKLFESSTDFGDDFEVGTLAPSSNVVLLTDPASSEDCQDRFAVVADKQPVAYVLTVAINRNGVGLDRFRNRERN